MCIYVVYCIYMAMYFILYNKATWPKIDTIFTWLNAMAIISHFCKMTVAIIQGWHLLQHDNDCHGYYSKTRQFYGTNNSICYILLYTTQAPS